MTSGVLETDRLLLCPWSETHTALLARLSSKPDVVRYIGSGIPWAPSTAAEVAARQLEHWREHGFGWRAAIEKATGERVGFMTLNVAGEGTLGLDPSEHEIGWWLDPAAWGRGFAREGGRAMRDEAFGSVHATSVVARIQPENGASIGVASAIGLVFDFSTTGRAAEPVDVYRLTSSTVSSGPGRYSFA